MGPLRKCHCSHHFTTQSSHFVDRAGWQAKWLPLKFGYHDVMRTAPIWPSKISTRAVANDDNTPYLSMGFTVTCWTSAWLTSEHELGRQSVTRRSQVRTPVTGSTCRRRGSVQCRYGYRRLRTERSVVIGKHGQIIWQKKMKNKTLLKRCKDGKADSQMWIKLINCDHAFNHPNLSQYDFETLWRMVRVNNECLILYDLMTSLLQTCFIEIVAEEESKGDAHRWR